MSKICTVCIVEKPLNDFHKDKNGRLGVVSMCKSCKSIKMVDYKINGGRVREEKTNRETYLQTNGLKPCGRCKIDKPLSEFHKDKNGTYGVMTVCKSCREVISLKYYWANRDSILERQNAIYKVTNGAASKAYALANKDKISARNKIYGPKHYLENRDRILKQQAEYTKRNLAAVRAQQKLWREANQEWLIEYRKINAAHIAAHNKAYHLAHPEIKENYRIRTKDHRSKIGAAYYASHKDEILAYSRAWSKANPQKRKIYKHTYRTKLSLAGGSYTEADILEKKILQDFMCPYCTTSIVDYWHDDHLYSVENGGTSHGRNLQPTCEPCNLSKGDKLHSDFLRYRELHGIPTRQYAYDIIDIESTDEYKYHRWLLGEIETPETMFDANILSRDLI